MPRLNVDAQLGAYYEVDDYTDPWKWSHTVLSLHGLGESDAVAGIACSEAHRRADPEPAA